MSSQHPLTDSDIEAKIQAKTLNAPHITSAQIDALCYGLTFKTHHFPETNVTVARAFLPSGFMVGRGESSCVDPANFDAEIGVEIAMDNARRNARENLWEFEGYALHKYLQAPPAHPAPETVLHDFAAWRLAQGIGDEAHQALMNQIHDFVHCVAPVPEDAPVDPAMADDMAEMVG